MLGMFLFPPLPLSLHSLTCISYDDMSVIAALNDSDLEILKIKPGHKKKILMNSAMLQTTSTTPTSTIHIASAPTSTPKKVR